MIQSDDIQEKIDKLEESKTKPSHIIHLIISVFFFPWVLVWAWSTKLSYEENRRIDEKIAKIKGEKFDKHSPEKQVKSLWELL